ncbi:transcriptional regulator FtrA [Cupriavidus sp.]|uniref:transcriptional regulator FtrA n=1 Tax=Cupriavidus sp. TaxID=1873897 RepID=UPI003D10B5BC
MRDVEKMGQNRLLVASKPISVPIVPKTKSQSSVNAGLVAVVVYDGLSLFEYGCAVEVFGLPRPEMGENWYRFMTCSAEPGRLRGSGGIQVQADGGLELLAKARTIIIPGWRGIEADVPPELCRALRKANKRGARVMSICTGAFVLAAAGLLDGKRATTHWRHAAALAARYPEVHVEADVLYVDAGDVLTSAGSAAGIDLCLHLIRRDLGPRAANQVARRLVMPPHREGGQAQYIDEPVSKRSGASLAPLVDAVRATLDEGWSIVRMARQTAMSARTFQRHFVSAMGMPPGEWLLSERLGRARALLEETDLSVDEIAVQVGFGAATTLRNHFRTRLGTSPGYYRRRFSASEAH